MKRAGIIIAALGIVALRADAGDNPTYPTPAYQSGYYMTPLLSGPRPLVQTTATQNMPASYIRGGASTSGAQPACASCDRGNHGGCERGLWQKLKDFLTWRPAQACDCELRPTHYTPPLTAFFQCHEGCANFGQCSTCGKARIHAGHTCATCSGAGAAGAPVGAQSLMRQPAVNSQRMTTPAAAPDRTMKQTIEPYMAAKPPASPYGPANPAAHQPYQYTKAVNSATVQPATTATQPAVVPASYRVQPSTYYLPRD